MVVAHTTEQERSDDERDHGSKSSTRVHLSHSHGLRLSGRIESLHRPCACAIRTRHDPRTSRNVLPERRAASVASHDMDLHVRTFRLGRGPDGGAGAFAAGAFVVADVVGVFDVLVVAAFAAATPPNRSAPATAVPARTLRIGCIDHLLRCRVDRSVVSQAVDPWNRPGRGSENTRTCTGGSPRRQTLSIATDVRAARGHQRRHVAELARRTPTARRRSATRARRMNEFVAMPARGETTHPQR